MDQYNITATNVAVDDVFRFATTSQRIAVDLASALDSSPAWANVTVLQNSEPFDWGGV